jgi:hypothetical protein
MRPKKAMRALAVYELHVKHVRRNIDNKHHICSIFVGEEDPGVRVVRPRRDHVERGLQHFQKYFILFCVLWVA